MYNQSNQIRAEWDAILTRVADLAETDLSIIAHAPPATLADLWSRPDLGMAFMCGLPFARLAPEARPIALAAPISREAWANGQPLYASRIVVRSDGPLRDVAQLATARWGWTVRDSQSGYHAPRQFLAETFGACVALPDTIGELVTPVGVLSALRDNRIEAGAVDAFAYQLIERFEPALLDGTRVLATTVSRPTPLLVAARGLDEAVIGRLRAGLLTLADDADSKTLLDKMGIEGFVAVDPAEYDALPRWADATNAILERAW
jgi:ABC-type phosphate/phosphonate transport system substrate-binding protein